MVKLRAGVIGVGHLGQHHARLYASLPDSTLVGVVDQDRDRAGLIADRHGAQVFTAVTDLLPKVDVVSIAVPTSGHYPIAKACLEAKKHVLVEKPIAVLPSEAHELVGLATVNGCRLQVGHSERFNPIWGMMHSHVQRPMLIECQRLGTYTGRGVDVDVVLDLMIHDLDLVLSLNPGPVEEVRAAGISVRSPTNDVAHAWVQFRSGCVASLTASRIAPSAMRRLRLFQPDGEISVDFQSRQGTLGRRVQEPGQSLNMTVEEFKAGDEEPLRLQLTSFLHAVRTHANPVVSGEAGAAAVEIAHQVLSAITVFGQRHV